VNRLGFEDRIAEIVSADIVCPAVGQGALAIETTIATGRQSALWEKLDDPPSRIAVTGERALLAALGGGCQVPIGALGTVAGGTLHLRGIVVSPASFLPQPITEPSVLTANTDSYPAAIDWN